MFYAIFSFFRTILLVSRVFNVCLCSRQTCDGHTVGRAGNIAQTDFVAEFDGRRIAAVFAANTKVHFGTNALTAVNSHLHQFANARRIQSCERIRFVNLVCIVCRQELTSIVTRETERHLRQVVRTEAEEFRFFCDVFRRQACTGNFNHRTNFIFKSNAACSDYLATLRKGTL